MKIENSSYNLAGFDHFKIEILVGLKRVIYKELEDMVYRMGITYDEIADILDVKDIEGSTIGYTKPAGISGISDIKLTLKSLLPNKVKVNITIDDSRLRSNITTNKTIKFIEK